MMLWRHAVVVLLYWLNSVNTLGTMAAGLIQGVNNYLFHKLTQKGRGQFGRFSVLQSSENSEH